MLIRATGSKQGVGGAAGVPFDISLALPLALVGVSAVAVYANAIFNGFVIDDLSQVVGNPWIRHIRHLPEVFTSNLWGYEGRESNYYRPLMHVVYLLIYQLFGLKQWAYHVVNILVHSGVSVLVFLTAKRLLSEGQSDFRTERLFPPTLAALVFAVHPIHVEAVAWVGGITDLSCAFFYLLSLYFFMQREPRSKAGPLLSAFFFLIAALFKEPALTLPAVMLAYDFLFRRDNLRLSGVTKRYFAVVIVVVGYFALRLYALGGLSPVRAARELTPYGYVLNAFVLFRRYLEMLVFPIGLNVWHVFQPISSLISVKGAVSVLATIAFAALAMAAGRRHPAVSFAMVLIAFPIFPALYLPGLTQGIENAFTERYLYLPSVGFVLLVGTFAKWMGSRMPNRKLAVVVILSTLVVAYAVGTINRNTAWKDSFSLWSDAVRKSPQSAKAHEILGYALLYRGETNEGVGQIRTAMKLKPDFFMEVLNKGILYGQKGLIDKAIFTFHIALICRPDSADAHYNLGVAYDRKGWTDQAIEQYRLAAQLNPANAAVRGNLGIAYAKRGLVDKAIEALAEAVRLNPKDPESHRNLANALEMKGMLEEAERHRREADRLGTAR